MHDQQSLGSSIALKGCSPQQPRVSGTGHSESYIAKQNNSSREQVNTGMDLATAGTGTSPAADSAGVGAQSRPIACSSLYAGLFCPRGFFLPGPSNGRY